MADENQKEASESVIIISVEEAKRPKVWGSARMTMTILSFFALFHVMLLRFNLSMAIVCMTGTTLNSTEEGGEQAIEVI